MVPPVIQEEFRPAIVRALGLCEDQYGGRLRAAFLVGSAAFGEAWPGASDVDLFLFLDCEPNEADRWWSARTGCVLSGDLPPGSEFHVAVHHLQRLREDETWRYLLRYFAIQLCGGDSLANLERDGLSVPSPSKSIAKAMVGTIRKILDETMQKGFPEWVFPLPKEPWKATRKLARWFVIREGSTLLMAEGRLSSLRQADVLGQLKATFPQWTECFMLTERILTDPVGAGVSPERFMTVVAPFIRWAVDRVGSVSTDIPAEGAVD